MKNFIIILYLVFPLILSAQNSLSYNYDNNNRIINVTYDNNTQINYTYDALGNRLTKVVQGTEFDLYLQNPSPASIYAQPGESVQLSVNGRVNFNGAAFDLEDIKLAYYLSNDCDLDNNDNELVQTAFDLPQGSTNTNQTLTFTIPSNLENGNYKIILVIDDNQHFIEFNEGNNTLCIDLIINNVADTIDPVVITQNLILSLNQNGLATITADQINNGSYDNFTLSENLNLDIDLTNFNCSDIGENEVILTVTDAAGNDAFAPAIVTVVDDLAPTLETIDEITVELVNSSVSVSTSMVILNIDDNCDELISTGLTLNTFSRPGTYYVHVNATDGYNNVTSNPLTVHVVNSLSTQDQEANHLIIYPNPAESLVYIQTSLSVERIEVFTRNGRLVQTYTNTNNVNMKTLSTGYYILRIKTNEGYILKSIIKK